MTTKLAFMVADNAPPTTAFTAPLPRPVVQSVEAPVAVATQYSSHTDADLVAIALHEPAWQGLGFASEAACQAFIDAHPPLVGFVHPVFLEFRRRDYERTRPEREAKALADRLEAEQRETERREIAIEEQKASRARARIARAAELQKSFADQIERFQNPLPGGVPLHTYSDFERLLMGGEGAINRSYGVARLNTLGPEIPEQIIFQDNLARVQGLISASDKASQVPSQSEIAAQIAAILEREFGPAPVSLAVLPVASEDEADAPGLDDEGSTSDEAFTGEADLAGEQFIDEPLPDEPPLEDNQPTDEYYGDEPVEELQPDELQPEPIEGDGGIGDNSSAYGIEALPLEQAPEPPPQPVKAKAKSKKRKR